MSNKKRVVLIVVLIAALLLQSSQAFAFGRGRPIPHFYPHGRTFNALPFIAATLIIAGAAYAYNEGVFYRRAADHYVVVQAPVGAVVTSIPAGYQPVIIDGTPYYFINGVTYRATPYGYQVVPQPQTVIVQNPTNVQDQPVVTPVQYAPTAERGLAPKPGEKFTVNIPNAHGGYSPVTLKRSGSGFVGPQGEYYTEFPAIEQLKVMYGK